MYEFFIGVIIYVALVCFFLYFCIKYEKQQTEEDIVSGAKKWPRKAGAKFFFEDERDWKGTSFGKSFEKK